LETNKKRLLLGGVAVIAVVCVAIVVIQAQAQRQTSAFEELSEVKIPSGLGAQPLAGAAGQYLKVAEENSGTRAAGWAVLLAGGSYFSEGKYSDAQSQFERFLKEYPDSPWQSGAHLGIASCLDVQGKTNEAVAKFEELRRRFAGDAVVDEAKLALGRLYEGQGKNEDAFKLYDEVMKAGMAMQSGLAMEAGARMEDLTKRYPELARPKTPIIPTNLITQPILMTNPPMVRSTNQALALSNAMWRATSGIPRVITNAVKGTNAITNATLLLNNPPAATPPK
jgi:tetratricopeptide (TPR) repeat protein